MNYSNCDCRLRRTLLPPASHEPATLDAPVFTPPLKHPAKRRKSPRKTLAVVSLLLTCCAQAGDLSGERNADWPPETPPTGLSAVTGTLLCISGAVAIFGLVAVNFHATDC